MDFTTWEPAYEALLADFGYDRAADERTRDRLARATTPFDLDRLGTFAGATVAVAGAGPSLPAEVGRAAAADAVVGASTAADVLADHGVDVDLQVTDLDGDPGTTRRLTEAGTPVAVHAHGDNRSLLDEHLPRLDGDQVLPTTQAAPVGPVRNFGGFTDGDRGAFLADHLGAATLRFPGWDFEDPAVGPAKARKLEWAALLLHWLERRRGERFDVLDGRRDDLELPWLTDGD